MIRFPNKLSIKTETLIVCFGRESESLNLSWHLKIYLRFILASGLMVDCIIVRFHKTKIRVASHDALVFALVNSQLPINQCIQL